MHGCVLKAESLRLVFASTFPFVNLVMCDMARMRFDALQWLFGISREADYAADFVFRSFTRQI